MTHIRFDGADNLLGDFVLQGEDVVQLPVVPFDPDVRTTFCVDQLRNKAYPRSGSSDAAFENITHAEFAADLLRVGFAVLINKARIARDNEKPLDSCQT